MATGRFAETIETQRPPAVCWDTMTGVERFAGWVDLVESITEVEPLRRYVAVLHDRIGMFRVRADLDVTVTELVEGSSIRFLAEGEDRQAGSHLKIQAGMALEPSEAGTTLDLSGTYEVQGRLATMGDAMIRRKAEAAVQQFFGRVREELA